MSTANSLINATCWHGGKELLMSATSTKMFNLSHITASIYIFIFYWRYWLRLDEATLFFVSWQLIDCGGWTPCTHTFQLASEAREQRQSGPSPTFRENTLPLKTWAPPCSLVYLLLLNDKQCLNLMRSFNISTALCLGNSLKNHLLHLCFSLSSCPLCPTGIVNVTKSSTFTGRSTLCG